MGWLLLVIQIVFAAAALWGFVKSLQQHKEIAMSPSVAAAKAKVTRLSMYVGITFVGLFGSVFFSDRSMGFVLFAIAGSLSHFILAGILIWLRGRALAKKGQSPASLTSENAMLRVRKLCSGRIRGHGEGESMVYFSKEDLDGLVGVRGHASMLNWAVCRTFAVGVIEPIWLFVSTDGDRFLLYPDDQVEVIVS